MSALEYSYKFPMASLTVDGVVFTRGKKDNLKVLAIKRGEEPHKGKWVFPGGHVNIIDNEKTIDAVRREVREETGLDIHDWIQIGAFTDPGRDPRGRVVSVAYFSIVNCEIAIKGGDDAEEARWLVVDKDLFDCLAFDHSDMLISALNCFLTELNLLRNPLFNRLTVGETKWYKEKIRDVLGVYASL